MLRVSRAHLRGLAPEQHSSEGTSKRWRAIGDSVSDLTGPRFEPQIFRTDSNVLTSEITGWFGRGSVECNFILKNMLLYFSAGKTF